MSKKERVDTQNISLEKELIEEIEKETTAHNLEEIKSYPFILSKMMKYNPFDFKFFLNFTDNEKEYNKFISINGFDLIPKRYYWNCCNIVVNEPGIKIQQLHNSKIQNDNKCDYIFLIVTYDYKKVKLSSFNWKNNKVV